jgi:hypothetical protein
LALMRSRSTARPFLVWLRIIGPMTRAIREGLTISIVFVTLVPLLPASRSKAWRTVPIEPRASKAKRLPGV